MAIIERNKKKQLLTIVSTLTHLQGFLATFGGKIRKQHASWIDFLKIAKQIPEGYKYYTRFTINCLLRHPWGTATSQQQCTFQLRLSRSYSLVNNRQF